MHNKTKFALFYVGLMACSGLRADYYVAQNGQDPAWPHTNWTAAASNIQDAVMVATNRSTVWVDAGTYQFPTNAISSNVVAITNALTLRSVNGAASTIIDGGTSNRCVLINLAAAACAVGPVIVDGFTLTNGFSDSRGAGIYLYGAAIGTGIVQNCIVSGNTVEKNVADPSAGGGGIHAHVGSFVPVISNCLVAGNSTITGSEDTSSGGGLWFRASGLIVDCVFRDNVSSQLGGAMYFSSPRSVVDRCTIISNTAASNGGGVYMHSAGGELRNSLVAYNTAGSVGGVYGYNVLRMYNCTVVSNSSYGVYARSTVGAGVVDNCIIDSISVSATATVTGYNNCLPSIPTATNSVWHNTLVTTNNPDYIGFVDAAAGDFRLRRDSPCVNAGVNQPDWLALARDRDGRARLDRLSRIPDIGCYEYVPRGTIIGLR